MAAERLRGMNLYQMIAADWRIRLLAQVACAPQPRPRCTDRPVGDVAPSPRGQR